MLFSALLAAKIQRAMERSKAPSGLPWSGESLSEAINNQPYGVSISPTYIRTLRSGKQANPSIAAIEVIARALKIPVRYFLPSTPDDLDQVIEADYIERLMADLSSDSRAALVALIEQCREQEGLPPVAYPQHEGAPASAPQQQRRGWIKRFFQDADTPSDDDLVRVIIQSLQGGPVRQVRDDMD